MRLFIGIDIPETIRNSLAGLQNELKKRGIQGSWKYMGNFHVTLEFLGETNSSAIPVLAGVMQKAAGIQKMFSLSIGGIDAFPSLRNPKILWTGIHGDLTALHQVHDSLHAELTRHHFQVEERKFMPHITLASRLKPGSFDFSGIDHQDLGEFSVKELVLYDSKQELGKRIYTGVERVRLEIRDF